LRERQPASHPVTVDADAIVDALGEADEAYRRGELARGTGSE
jgi:hypothetical protein